MNDFMPISPLTNPADTLPFETPWRGGARGASRGVVFPCSTEEVVEIARECFTNNIPMLPQGGNTGLVYGSTPRPNADEPPLIINLQRMKRVIEIDSERYTATAEAGCILQTFKEKIEEAGLFFPLDMGSKGTARLGGIVATAAGGINFLRYGGMHQLTVGVEVVLADGQVLNLLTQVDKDNTGYNLTPLFTGSEGTLGIITQVQVKLFPLPKQRASALVALCNVADAATLFAKLSAMHKEKLSAFELINPVAYRAVADRFGDPFGAESSQYSAFALIEFSTAEPGDSVAELLMETLAANLESGLLTNAVFDKPDHFWKLRESISEALNHHGQVIPNDISIPVQKLPAILAELDAAVAKHYPDLRLAWFGHFGDGNIHYNPVSPTPLDEAERTALQDLVCDVVMKSGGSPVAEHGIGVKNRRYLRLYKSPEIVQTMAALKQVFDPKGLMNPGVIF